MSTDLDILHEFGETLTPVDDRPSARTRLRVINGMRGDVDGRRGLSRLFRTRAPRGRLAWRIGAPAGVAAAIVAGLIAGQRGDVAGNEPSPPGGPGRVTAQPAGASEDARQVLRLAAQQAAGVPTLTADPEQFIFTESVEVNSDVVPTRDRHGTVLRWDLRPSKPMLTRSWISVDGKRDSLVTEQRYGAPGAKVERFRLDGCKNGRQAQTIDRPDTTPKVPCEPTPGYVRRDVPTDPTALRAFVYGREQIEDGEGYENSYPRDQRAFERIAKLAAGHQSSAVHAALFRVAESIPGVEVVRNVTDAIGRPGVAVTRAAGGSRLEMVFDAKTHRHLGERSVLTAPDPTGFVYGAQGEPGTVTYSVARLRTAVVDRVGQLP